MGPVASPSEKQFADARAALKWRARFLPPAIMAALLAGCNDSGSPTPTPTPTPTTANAAPVFTSPAAVSVVENTTLAYRPTATDANNDTIIYSLNGGPDVARFTISGTGQISFVTAPNFELPTDADGNNVYQVTVQATDGKSTTNLDVQITVTNSNEGITVRRIATGFVQPMQVYKVPNSDDELYVIEKGGRIYRLNVNTGARTLEATAANLSTDGERGLLGMTTGPGRGSNTLAAYFTATAPDGTIELRQYGLDLVTGTFNTPLVYNVLVSVPHSQNNNHNGGWIDFGADGQLYMAVGDGGGAGDTDNNAQNPNSRLGKILRLSLNGSTWGPSPSNPFAVSGGDPYIFALGLRNPFRNGFEGNNLIIGDVGQETTEEVDITSISQAGANLGWRFLEGTKPFLGTAPSGLIPPVLQYGHGSGPRQGASVIGGRVYHGPITSLEGSYVFGDYVGKHIWTVPYSRLVSGPLLDGQGFENRDADFTPDVGTIDMPVDFGTDRAGRMYIVDLDGEIYRIEQAVGTL